MKNKKSLLITFAFALIIFAIIVFFRHNEGTKILWEWSDEGRWLLPLVAISALLDSINPCAFSVLLLTIAFLLSIGRLRSNILKIGGFYILGLFVIYLGIGLGILQALHLFNTPNFMAKVGATLLIALGAINIVNEFFPSFPIKLRIPQKAHPKIAALMEKASLPTAFLLGGLVGLCEFPCTGGPYLLVLGLLHDKATFLKGLAYLVFYNLLFVLPLVIILLIAGNESLVEKVNQWRKEKTRAMKLYSGLAMIGLGIFIFLL